MNRMTWATAFAAGLACSPFASHAASLGAFAGVVGGAGNGSISGGCTTYGPPSELAFFGGFAAGLQVLGGNAACGYSGGWTNPTSTGTTTPITAGASLSPTVLGNPGYAESFDGTANARAAYGALSAKAHGHYSGSPASYTAGTTIAASVGAATFSDTLTATVPTKYTDVSSSGFVRYQFTIDGSMSTPGTPMPYLGGEALTDFRLQHDGGPIYDELIAHTYTGNLGTVSGVAAAAGWTLGIGSVTGGNAFETGMFSIDLLKSWSFTAGLIVNAYGNADNDFYSTAKLVGVELFDAQGHAIDGYSLSSASGVNYLAAVPEPSAAAMLCAGLLALGGCARRRTAGNSRRRDGHHRALGAAARGAEADRAA